MLFFVLGETEFQNLKDI